MNFRNAEFTLSGGFHRQLSRRQSERLCRARHLSIILRIGSGQALPDRTAGPAPAVLGLTSACGDTNLTGSRQQATPSLVVASCVERCPRAVPEGLSAATSMTRRRQAKQTRVLAYPHFLFAVATGVACGARCVRMAIT